MNPSSMRPTKRGRLFMQCFHGARFRFDRIGESIHNCPPPFSLFGSGNLRETKWTNRAITSLSQPIKRH
jgi:hypothetical protein